VGSASFVVSAPGVTCTAPCTAPSVQQPAVGTTATVGASGGNGGTLAVSLLTTPSLCGGFTPIGQITNFEVFGGATAPSFDITWTVKFSNTLNPELIAKSVTSVDICLGTINTTPGYTGPGFKIKGGGTAPRQADGFFWGLLPSCGSSTGPCIYSWSKISSTVNGKTNGTISLKFKVGAPWDGKFTGG
jgi:hypothetical protein